MSDENLKPVEKRLAAARKLAGRVDKLLEKKRRKDPDYSEAEFCRTHGFDYGFFNRVKNLRVIPFQSTLHLFDAALKKEKV